MSERIQGLIEEGEAFRRLGAVEERAASGRRFHRAMAIAFLVTALAGFAPSYFLRGLSTGPSLGPLLHLHGAAFTSWLVLLVVQTTLVAKRRVDIHKRLGIAGAVLAAAMIPLGIMTALGAARGDFPPAQPLPLAFLVFPLGQIVLFAGFIGTALWNRRRPELHRRLVLLATATLVTPAISRIVGNPILALMLTLLFVVAGMIHDWRSRGRVHPVYIVGAVVLFLSGPLRGALGHTAAWESFARFLVG